MVLLNGSLLHPELRWVLPIGLRFLVSTSMKVEGGAGVGEPQSASRGSCAQLDLKVR